MLLRQARPEDAARIAEIYRPYVEYTCYTFEYDAPDAEEFKRRMRDIQSFFPFFVLEEEGNVLGYAYAHAFRERAAFDWCCETSVYVDCRCRMKGVGRAVYSALLEALKEQGFTKAYAVLGCPNEPSEAFHAALGFTLEGELPDVGYKHDGWHATKYMAKTLNEPRRNMAPPRPFQSLWKS